MIDISTYRLRIGVFGNGHLCPSALRKFDCRQKQICAFFHPLKFLVVIGLAICCALMDPAVELNPGPGIHPAAPFAYESEFEKKCFNVLRSLNKDYVTIESHKEFLHNCLEKRVIPNGLTTSFPKAASKHDKDIDSIASIIAQHGSFTYMEALAAHYDLVLHQLTDQLRVEKMRLRSICSTQRFTYLSRKLSFFKRELLQQLSKTKAKKLGKLLSKHNTSLSVPPNPWLPDLNLTTVEKGFITAGQEICDRTIDAAMRLIEKSFPHLQFQPTCLGPEHLVYSPKPTIHVHHNGQHHFVTTRSIGNIVKLYDSLNLAPSMSLLQQICSLYSPKLDTFPTVHQSKIFSPQKGTRDCGLYAIAYATELAFGFDPSKYIFEQVRMRDHLLGCFENRKIERFPKIRTLNNTCEYIDVTSALSEFHCWKIPKKTCKPTQQNLQTTGINLRNRFTTLSSDSKNTDQHVSTSEQFDKVPKNNISIQSENKSLYLNLSDRQLSADEISVLELGLSFCPSQKNFNKEQIAADFYRFTRKLRLTEYWHEKHGQNKDHSTQNLPHDTITDQCNLDWPKSNPYWYPEEVRKGRSKGLEEFITTFTSNFKSQTNAAQMHHWNNMSQKQRLALSTLENDPTIVIKPADKGGKLVIMNRTDYDKECLKILTNTDFYEELQLDPNPNYVSKVQAQTKELLQLGYVDKQEARVMTSSSRTPLFYGLPKIHKYFGEFPQLRPICSGYESCTVKISEFIDSFLKPIAQRAPSFIRDTTDFVCKLADPLPEAVNPANLWMVTMDVISLYPNICHEDGISACTDFLQMRHKKTVPTTMLTSLIETVLTSNTMLFDNRLFHQTRGTAMGTPFAVNYANTFMRKFESRLLPSYRHLFETPPLRWYRSIADLFFVCEGG